MPESQLQPNDKSALLVEFQRYARVGTQYMNPYWEDAVRFYKIYNAVKDSIPEETDEERDLPNIFLPYAFGIVESIVSKATEPLFTLKPPVKVQAKEAEDEEKAENFEGYLRTIYNRPEFQLGYTMSNRECVIAGWAWEKDEWAMQYIIGKRWIKRPKTDIVSRMVRTAQRVVKMNIPVESEEYVEVQHEFPERVGFWVKFPSIFDVIPEPGVRNVKDMHWLIEQERYVPLSDLKNQFYEDSEGNKIPVYDLSEVEKDLGGGQPGSIKPQLPTELQETDFADELYSALSARESTPEGSAQRPTGDLDRLHLSHVWTKEKYFCIANGKYVICKRDMPFHRPRIPYRLKVYTQRNHTPIGMGAIEPVEHLLYFLNDSQNLAMQQWINLTNKMLVVQENAIVSNDDFRPRPGGRIRIRATARVQDAVFPIDHDDSTASMLSHQSNIRGLVEWADGISDLSPGSEGTKQFHKTATGLLEIQESLERRFAVMKRQFMSNFQDQAQFASELVEQFQFSPTSIMVLTGDGKPTFKNVTREDLTSAVGFDFLIEHDPSFGNESVRRDHSVFAFKLFMEYERARIEMQKGEWPEANVPESLRKVAQNFGWADTSNILKPADGKIAPEKKFEMIARGVIVPPTLNDDLVGTALFFSQALTSPEFAESVQTGSVPPESVLALNAHLRATLIVLDQISKNPQAVAQAKEQEELQKQASLPGPIVGKDIADAGKLNKVGP